MYNVYVHHIYIYIILCINVSYKATVNIASRKIFIILIRCYYKFILTTENSRVLPLSIVTGRELYGPRRVHSQIYFLIYLSIEHIFFSIIHLSCP